MFTRGNGVTVPPQGGNGSGYSSTPPAAQNDLITTRIELAHPLSGHNGAIAELALRLPTFGDYLDCGPVQRHIARHPGTSQLAVEVVEDPEAIIRWMVRLTGQPEAILRQLSARDSFAIRREIARMVQEFDQGNSPSGPTS